MNAAITFGASDCASPINALLQRIYGPMKHGAKLLARDADATPRAAENWLAGLCSPQAEKLINLMRENDEIAAEILRLIGRE